MLKDILKKVPNARKLTRAIGLTPQSLNSNRFLLDRLPKRSVGAEIGVHMGDFLQKARAISGHLIIYY